MFEGGGVLLIGLPTTTAEDDLNEVGDAEEELGTPGLPVLTGAPVTPGRPGVDDLIGIGFTEGEEDALGVEEGAGTPGA